MKIMTTVTISLLFLVLLIFIFFLGQVLSKPELPNTPADIRIFFYNYNTYVAEHAGGILQPITQQQIESFFTLGSTILLENEFSLQIEHEDGVILRIDLVRKAESREELQSIPLEAIEHKMLAILFGLDPEIDDRNRTTSIHLMVEHVGVAFTRPPTPEAPGYSSIVEFDWYRVILRLDADNVLSYTVLTSSILFNY